MTIYPNGIDSVLQLPTVPGSSTEAVAINAVRDAAIAVETELGILPKGIYSDVSTRLTILESRIGPGPIGSTGGLIDAGTQLAGIVKIVNGGTGLSSIGSINTILASTGSALVYKLLDNSNVSSSAAIDGYKINPDFSSQAVIGSSYTLGSSGPTITKGTGAPSSTEPNGSIFLRTDGTALTGLYTRQSSTWSAIGYTTPTGTGFLHITSGTQDAAAKLVDNADVSTTAAIAGTKISPNFGTQDISTTGNISANAITFGATPATTGQIRFSSTQGMWIRNAANTANLPIFTTDASDNLVVGTNTTGATLTLKTPATLTLQAGSAVNTLGTSLNSFPQPIATGTNPASTGQLRLPSQAGINYRNFANTADFSVVSTDTSNNVFFGDAANQGTTYLRGPSQLGFIVSGSAYVTLTSSALAMTPAITWGSNVASAGLIKFGNSLGTVMSQRNAANSADLVFLSLNTTDGYIGSTNGKGSNLSNIHIAPSTSTNIYTGSTLQASFTSSLASFTQPIAVGANPASSGAINVGNAAYVYGRNAANSVDLRGIGFDSSNNLVIGENTSQQNNVVINSHSATTIQLANGGSTHFTVAQSLNTSANPIAIGTNPAAAGDVRLANGATITVRNSGNTADLTAIQSSGNNINIGATTNSGNLLVVAASTQNVQILSGATTVATFANTLTTFTNPLAVGSTAAASGQIRLPNNTAINFRNAANSADLPLIISDSSNNIIIGGNSSVPELYLGTNTAFSSQVTNLRAYASSSVFLGLAGSNYLTINSSGLLVNSSIPIYFAAVASSAATGKLRLANNPSTVLAQRNSGNTADLPLLSASATEAFFATDTAFSAQSTNARIYAASGVYSGIGSTTITLVDSNGILINDKNLSVGASPTYGGGSIVAFFKNAATNPSSNPTGGNILYVDGADGYFKYLKPDGTTISLNGSGGGGGLSVSGTGLVKVVSGTIQSAASLLVDADVNASAAIAGTKISPDFGSQNVLTTGAISLGTNPASTGQIRIPNNTAINFRNAANNADLGLISSDASNNVYLGTTTGQAASVVRCPSASHVLIGVGGFNYEFNSAALNMSTNPIEFGTSALATTGKLKFANNPGTISAQRNSANTADIALWAANTTDGYLGSDTSKSTNLTNVHIAPTTSTNIFAGSTQLASFTSSLATVNTSMAVGTNPATQGTLRLQGGNSFVLVTRNAANTSDIIWLQQDGANNMTIGSTSGNNIQVQTGGSVTMSRSGVTIIDYNGTVIGNYLPVRFTATNPAASGILRFGNATGVLMAQRNSGNTQDMPLMSASTTELFLGTDTAFSNQMGNIRLYGSGTVYMGTGSTTVLSVDSTSGIQPVNHPIAFAIANTNVKVKQLDTTTASATGQTMTVQAQNATGTTSTGGALTLTSGTGTTAAGAVNIQVGGTSVLTVDSTTQVTSKATTNIYSGNSKVTITEVIANVQTTDATVTTAASGTIPTGISAFDAIVTAIKSDNSQGATYKRSIVFRNNAGTVATIGAVTDNGTFEDDSTWDCTIDNSTTTWRVRVTGKAATNITWHACVRRSEGIA